MHPYEYCFLFTINEFCFLKIRPNFRCSEKVWEKVEWEKLRLHLIYTELHLYLFGTAMLFPLKKRQRFASRRFQCWWQIYFSFGSVKHVFWHFAFRCIHLVTFLIWEKTDRWHAFGENRTELFGVNLSFVFLNTRTIHLHDLENIQKRPYYIFSKFRTKKKNVIFTIWQLS